MVCVEDFSIFISKHLNFFVSMSGGGFLSIILSH